MSNAIHRGDAFAIAASEDRPRILLLCDFYAPFIGGIERHVRTLAQELIRRGYHVAVATLRVGDLPAFEIDGGIRVHRIQGWNRALSRLYQVPGREWPTPLPDPGLVQGLRSVIAREQPDIVHARGWIMYSFLPLKPLGHARLIVTLHDYSLVCARKSFMFQGEEVCTGPSYGKCVTCAAGQYGGIVKSAAVTTGLFASSLMHGAVDRYLAVSRAVAAASAAGTRGKEIEVVPTFIPDSSLDEARESPRPSFLPEGDYLLFVGLLRAHKGLDILLRAYAELDGAPPLVLLGTRGEGTPDDFPVGVHVIYDVPHPQVMSAWAHCLFGVVPSVWPEPLGQVAVECMAVGRPVIASNIGGLPDVVIDGETGVLVPPGDVSALRDAMQSLLDDPDLRARLGARGAPRAKLFMVSHVADRLEEIYRAEYDSARAPSV
ncbi:MAG TPA: glycosyltransferase family 4 protein [Chloroflexota bacterium]|nr:glycosyltransferase family 4 protein [Chloroflexota bacterium]